MNFNQTLTLLDGVTSFCSATILLILATIVYRRTKDWGFFCWIISSSGMLLETLCLHAGSIQLRYYGGRSLIFATVLVFTVGAIRIVCRFLHLFSRSRSSSV